MIWYRYEGGINLLIFFWPYLFYYFFYLHVVHEDLSCHAHLQHSVHYEFAVGRQQISLLVKVLQPLHFRVLAG